VFTPALGLGVVMLAAGRSARMGRPKLLLPWGSTSVLGHLLGQWAALGAHHLVVVCAAGDQGIQSELDRLEVAPDQRVINPAPERGMFSSLQCAARWSGWRSGLTHWALVLGDQPHLRAETLRALLDLAAGHPAEVWQPTRGGHRRHPVIVSAKVFAELAGSAATDLREFLRLKMVAGCPSDDPGLDLDIDRPEDYQRALALIQD
jgi:molybdenum cofactor cytidylyltransferase